MKLISLFFLIGIISFQVFSDDIKSTTEKDLSVIFSLDKENKGEFVKMEMKGAPKERPYESITFKPFKPVNPADMYGPFKCQSVAVSEVSAEVFGIGIGKSPSRDFAVQIATYECWLNNPTPGGCTRPSCEPW